MLDIKDDTTDTKPIEEAKQGDMIADKVGFKDAKSH